MGPLIYNVESDELRSDEGFLEAVYNWGSLGRDAPSQADSRLEYSQLLEIMKTSWEIQNFMRE